MLEAQSNPQAAASITAEIREVAKSWTHMYVILLDLKIFSEITNLTLTCSVPHYVVSSHDVQAGKVSKGISWIRRFLIEDVYRSICKYKGRHVSLRLAHKGVILATMFPETENWKGSADKSVLLFSSLP